MPDFSGIIYPNICSFSYPYISFLLRRAAAAAAAQKNARRALLFYVISKTPFFKHNSLNERQVIFIGESAFDDRKKALEEAVENIVAAVEEVVDSLAAFEIEIDALRRTVSAVRMSLSD